MINQIEIASEQKDSNLASTLAHETRKNNIGRILFLSMCVMVAIAGATIMTSCNGENGEDEVDYENGSQNGNGNGNETSNVDVYVAGNARHFNNIQVAALWKNGVIQYLSEQFSTARSVFVSGSDVYVAGFGLLKNGVQQNLTTDYDWSARSVFVSGSDVYVAGTEFWVSPYGSGSISNAVSWKNGELQYRLTDVQNLGANFHANSVFVSGSDVYVAGVVGNSGATLWKNGVEQNLSQTNNDNDDYYSSANSVFVAGDDVYVAGYESWSDNYGYYYNAAILWKNGVAQSLSQTNHDDYDYYSSSANSVFVSGSDVYVAGGEYLHNEDGEGIRFVTLWKNGVTQHLSDEINYGEANSVFVLGDDVYVGGVGTVANGNIGGILWINGVAQNLSNAGEVYSVFVVPK